MAKQKQPHKEDSKPWEIFSARAGYLYITRIQGGERYTVACFQQDAGPDQEAADLIEMAPYNAARVKTLEKKVRQLQKELRETKALALFAGKYVD